MVLPFATIRAGAISSITSQSERAVDLEALNDVN
jgi:hypothetical protein